MRSVVVAAAMGTKSPRTIHSRPSETAPSELEISRETIRASCARRAKALAAPTLELAAVSRRTLRIIHAAQSNRHSVKPAWSGAMPPHVGQRSTGPTAAKCRARGGRSAKSAQPALDPQHQTRPQSSDQAASQPSPWRASHSRIGLRGPRTPNQHSGPINAVIRIPKARLQLISD